MLDETTEFKQERKTKYQIRLEVEKRWKARNEVIVHLVLFVAVMGTLWLVWFQLNGRNMIWPLLLTTVWGLAVVGHGLTYYQSYGGGAKRRAQQLEREVEAIYQRQKHNGKV